MFRIVIVIYIVTRTVGFNLEPIALKEPRQNLRFSDGRIIGGVETDIRDVPYQVALEYENLFCGGCLITENHILTGAYCFDRVTIKYLKIRFASNTSETGGIVYAAKTGYIHYNYTFYPYQYNVGIVELEKKAPLSDRVKIIPVADTEPPIYSLLLVSGYGLTEPVTYSNEPRMSRKLYSARIEVVSRRICWEAYGDKYIITDDTICAYTEGKSCSARDGGGPAVAIGRVYALYSWGFRCGKPGNPGVYTNLAQKDIRDFIREIAGV